MNQKPKIYTVSEFNRLAKEMLEKNFSDIWIEGEISNFRGAASSGHCYFSLKDEGAQIDVVAFRGVMSSLKFKLEEGLQVLLCGKASLYTQRGRFQVIAYFIEPKGAGALQLAFEQLKKKLEAEGLFDPARKKPIPALPQKIGIITSPTGAAIRDILTVINRRFANVEILIYPVKVQGEGAKEEIAEAIRYLNEHHKELEVLLVGRGGGSIEDLWAFNEELVARAIANSQIPVISCVGHEIDFTIADFVADLRAPTPSAAAELVVKNKAELHKNLFNLLERLQGQLYSLLKFFSEKLKGIAKLPSFAKPKEKLEEQLQILDELMERMALGWKNLFAKYQLQMNVFKTKIDHLSPSAQLKEKEKFLKLKFDNMVHNLSQKIEQFRAQLKAPAAELEALSPLAVLSRGYAIAWSLADNKIIKSVLQVSPEDKIRIKVHQGEIRAVVEERNLGNIGEAKTPSPSLTYPLKKGVAANTPSATEPSADTTLRKGNWETE